MASWRLKGKPGPPSIDAIASQRPIDADGGTLPADVPNEDLENMSEEQLRGYRARLSATIEAIDELAEFHALDADDDSLSAPESLPPETGSLPPAPESSPPAPEGLSPVTESSPEQTSGKFGQESPIPIVELLRKKIRERELREFGQDSPVEGLPPETGSLPPALESLPPEQRSGKFGQESPAGGA